MYLSLVTPKNKLFTGEAHSVSLRNTKGELQIFSDHAPFLSTLGQGAVIIDTKSGSKEFKISSGFIEVHKNQITLLAHDEEEG